MAQEGKIGLTISKELWKFLNSSRDAGETFDDVIRRLIKDEIPKPKK